MINIINTCLSKEGGEGEQQNMNYHEICNIILYLIFIHKIHLTQPPPMFQLYNSSTSEYCSTYATSSTVVEGDWHTTSINAGTAIFGQGRGRICLLSESQNFLISSLLRPSPSKSPIRSWLRGLLSMARRFQEPLPL